MRRIQRSNQQKIIAGVAGGLAEYFGVDPSLVRLAFVILAFANGIGLIAYIALWLIAPKASNQAEEAVKPETAPTEVRRREGWLWAGVVLIILGITLFINSLGQRFFWSSPPFFLWLPVVPLLLVIAGVIILWQWRKQGT